MLHHWPHCLLSMENAFSSLTRVLEGVFIVTWLHCSVRRSSCLKNVFAVFTVYRNSHFPDPNHLKPRDVTCVCVFCLVNGREGHADCHAYRTLDSRRQVYDELSIHPPPRRCQHVAPDGEMSQSSLYTGKTRNGTGIVCRSTFFASPFLRRSCLPLSLLFFFVLVIFVTGSGSESRE